MDNLEITNQISSVVDYLDKLIYMLKLNQKDEREYSIAIQKLEEAVFWLTYGIDEE